MDLNELRHKRASLIEEARGLNDKAEKEGRDLSDDEESRYQTIMSDANKLKDQIKREEELREAEASLESRDSDPELPEGRAAGSEPEKRVAPTDTKEYRNALNKYLRGGKEDLSKAELRALSVGTDAAGGYLVPAEDFQRELIKEIDDLVHLFQLARKVPLSQAKQLTFPKRTARMGDPTWTTEILTGSADSTLAYGQLTIKQRALARRILVSNTLLRDAVFDVEAEIRSEFAYEFATVVEAALLTGDGTSEMPVGIFDTTHDDKIPTTRDKAFASATAVDSNALIDIVYNQKPTYRKNSKWLFNRTNLIPSIQKLKDSEGNYIWKAGIEAGRPDTLLGYPVIESEFAPNTMTTGLYVGAFADFSQYLISLVMPMTVQRLNELYAETNQVGFIGRQEIGGKPRIAEAFTRIKMG